MQAVAVSIDDLPAEGGDYPEDQSDAQLVPTRQSEAQTPRGKPHQGGRLRAGGAAAPSMRGSRREPRAFRQSLYPASHLRSLVNGSFFLPHPSIPVSRGRSATGSGSFSGTCVAITSTPRHQSSGGGGNSWMQQAVRQGGEEEMTWELVERLLRLLDDRRAGPKGRGARRGRAGRGGGQLGDMWAVLLSSGCQVRLPADLDLSDGKAVEQYVDRLAAMSPLHDRSSVEDLLAVLERQQRLGLGRLADRHTQAVSDVAKGLSLETYVVPASQQACRLMQDAELLLQVVEPDRVGGEGWEKWLWRTKLALDFVYVMRQCLATDPRYILLLQDDTTPVKLWDLGIERFIGMDLQGKEPWTLLSLYHPDSFGFDTEHAQEYKLPCCAQAVLFDASKVPPLLEHMEADFMERPMDHNIKTYLENAEAHAYVHVPSLFQHEGEVRTTYMAASYHRDTSFDEDIVAKSVLNKAAA